MDYYVGDVVDYGNIYVNSLNLIVSSCGTGKSYYCANELLTKLNNIRPEEIMFVTSRTLAADQQVHDYELLVKLDKDDPIISFWNGECDIDNYADGTGYEDYVGKMRVFTYDKIIGMLFNKNNKHFNSSALKNVKAIIFDEIHSLFSDMFIDGMQCLQMWLHYEIPKGERIIFGLTATPGVLLSHMDLLGVKISLINDPLVKYKANQLWCVDLNNMLKCVNEKFEGKTIIMCRSVRICYALQKLIPGSRVLAGKSGSDYLPCEMDEIRNAIIDGCKLPDDVRVLISTSTAREGFTLVKDSNVRNVVCSYPDEMNIHQFIGRCRYDIDNLVVIDLDRKSDDEYFSSQEEKFKEYCEDYNNKDWFNLISDVVNHDYSCTKILIGKQPSELKRAEKPQKENPYIGLFKDRDSQSRLKDYAVNNLCGGVFIYGQQEKESILNEVKNIGVFGDNSDIKWPTFEKILKNMGFSISDERRYVLGKRVRGKTIERKDGD